MNEYTIYRAFLKKNNLIVATEKEPDDDGLIVLTQEEYNESMVSGPGDGEEWDVVTGCGMVVIYPAREMEFNDQRINKYVRRREEKNV